MSKIFQHQIWHLVTLIILLILSYQAVLLDQSLTSGSLWGVSTCTWLILALLSPILHQVYVLLCWRWELYYKGVTKLLGINGFKLYKIGFAVLIISRPVLVILLAISNAGTLNINPIIGIVLALILMLPVSFLAYSVGRYFGIDNAFGIDHFEPELARNRPMVKKGIFKYSSNAMYVFGFLSLYIPGLLAFSKAALLVALFNHLFIWAHYYFTELPDMRQIYRSKI